MTTVLPPRATSRPGRPRSESCRQAILAAAGELMLEGGLAAASIEAIAARAGVSKATIYKWWSSRNAVALDGFLAQVSDSLAIPEGSTTVEALEFQLDALLRLVRDTEVGPLLRALAAAAQSDPDLARALRERWLAPRRAVTAEIVRVAIARGDIRADVDVPLVLDQLFAPIYHRLVFGHDPLDDGLSQRLVANLLAGIAPTRQVPRRRVQK
jgi:AcrR family transcriptional regulator